MICLRHQQQYNQGEWCIYCGCPFKIITASTGTEKNIIDGESIVCECGSFRGSKSAHKIHLALSNKHGGKNRWSKSKII